MDEYRRPEMLPEALAYYDTDLSRLPDKLRISFSDGSTAVYCRQVEQPAPVIRTKIEIINGYQFEMPRRRRTRR